MKHFVVRALETACGWVDELAYRPAVVKATRRLPWWWRCELSRLSQWLDNRWATGYWEDWSVGGVCEACGRRAAWLMVGGWIDDDDIDIEPGDEKIFMANRRVDLCGWCTIDHERFYPIDDEAMLRRALADAAERSVAWTWRGKAG